MQDHEFIRGSLPMTKSEVRAVSLSKLELTPGAVFWDVGAGTGSVSIEAARALMWMDKGALSAEGGMQMEKGALAAEDGMWMEKTDLAAEDGAARHGKSHVYAIEKEEEGICLIEKNRKKHVPGYGAFSVIHGTAPGALEVLPAPTHVFIGGSRGELPLIVRLVLKKNPRARLVINVVTAESLFACMQLIGQFSFVAYEIIQVAVTRLEPVGPYHMQKAQNPVYIVVLQGGSHGT